MDINEATHTLTALSQPSRLEAFRLLVKHEPEGLAAGEVARLLDVPQNTMSSHLSILARAGLVTPERQSRSMIYRADLNRLRVLLLFLVTDCCRGRSELCEPLIAAMTECLPSSHKGC